MGAAKSLESEYHPLNDVRLLDRKKWYTERPANDPNFIFRLADKMETDKNLRQAVHSKFRRGDLTWLMHDGQKIILDTIIEHHEVKEFLILCSRQLGKSFFSLLYAIMHCAALKNGRRPLVKIFCETEKQVKEIVEDNMSLIQMLAPPGYIKHTKSDRRFKIGMGEVRIGLLAGARVDGKRGGNATLIITEEGAFSPSETFKYAIDSVISPQLLRSGGRLIHITTSSKDELHHIHEVIQPKCQEKGSLINLTIYNNPQLTDEQIIDAFERIYDGTAETWMREFLCMVFRSTTLTVVPEFDPRVVNRTEVPKYAHWISIIDFGGVRDKHGALVGYYDYNRNKVVICAENLMEINTGTSEIIKNVTDLESLLQNDLYNITSHNRFIDAPGQVRVDLSKVDFNCGFVEKGDGSFEAGIFDIRNAILNNQIEIWPECEMLIKSLRYGKLNKHRTDFERHPVFGHLDILAALMYFLRHINKNNPFPMNYNKSSQSHFINKNARLSEESTNLKRGLFG